MSDCDKNTSQDQDIMETTTNLTLDLFSAKTRDKYERVYTSFTNWRKEKKIKSFSENTLLAYFCELSKTYSSSTLWAQYLMLRLTLITKHNIDIGQYEKVIALLKRMGTGYTAKQSKIYSSENVQDFLNKAPDNKYLATKVALIFGIVGGCGREDLHSIKINHIEDTGSLAVVKLPRINKRMSRTFVIQDEYYGFYKKYSALRHKNTIVDNFFLNYKNGACTQQVIGIKKFGGMPSQIAAFLRLPNPKDYTGHSFRRTSAFLKFRKVHFKPYNNDGCEFNSDMTNEEHFDYLPKRKNICRACLTEESTFQSVFQTENNSGLLMPISEMMSACATIQVTEGDGLPEQICTGCAEVTVKMYLFKLKCEKSDEILRERLKKFPLRYEENYINESQVETLVSKIKVEPDENEKIAENKEIKEFKCDICLEKFSQEKLLEGHKLNHAIKTEELQIKEEKPFEINDIFNSSLDKEIKESTFSCPECDFVFVQKEDLDNHVVSFHNKKESEMSSFENFKKEDQLIYSESNLNSGPLNCDVCFEGSNQISKLNNHIKIHNNEKPFVCSTSGQGFNEKNNFLQHKNHAEIPFVQPISNRSFTHSDFSTDRIIIDSGEKPYECDKCKKRFKEPDHLRRHKRRSHVAVKPYECDTCKKKFSESTDLMKHTRIHTGEKPYECEICKKKFSYSCNLACHKRIHTDKKPFECDICEKKFSESAVLRRHKRIHTGEKPYGCEMCEKTFSDSSNLAGHKKTHEYALQFKDVKKRKTKKEIKAKGNLE